MTALSPSRPPFPNLATKSTSTAQSSQLNALADNKGASGRPSSRTVPVTTKPQPESGTSSEAATSERATSNLIRKTLVSEGQHATSDLRSTSPTLIDAILPPLTSSNDIDVQLYAIVAIIIKDFVNSWYTKITPDRVFVDEVVQIIAHCSRAVEQRIRGIDMSELILDELPSVVERHVIGKTKPPQAPGLCTTLTGFLYCLHSLSHRQCHFGRLAVRRQSPPSLPCFESTSSPRPFPPRGRPAQSRICLPATTRPRRFGPSPTHRGPY